MFKRANFCKLIEKSLHICVCSFNNYLQLKSFILNYITASNEIIIFNEIDNKNLYSFVDHDNPILYNTYEPHIKIICAHKKGNSEIKCSELSLIILIIILIKYQTLI